MPSVIVSCCPLTESTLPRSNVTVAKPSGGAHDRRALDGVREAAQARRPAALAVLAAAVGEPRVALVAAPAVAMALMPAPTATQQTATSSRRECLRMDDMGCDLACRCDLKMARSTVAPP